jgi:hypothetical protein
MATKNPQRRVFFRPAQTGATMLPGASVRRAGVMAQPRRVCQRLQAAGYAMRSEVVPGPRGPRFFFLAPGEILTEVVAHKNTFYLF